MILSKHVISEPVIITIEIVEKITGSESIAKTVRLEYLVTWYTKIAEYYILFYNSMVIIIRLFFQSM